MEVEIAKLRSEQRIESHTRQIIEATKKDIEALAQNLDQSDKARDHL
jgi:hypothetical protein